MNKNTAQRAWTSRKALLGMAALGSCLALSAAVAAPAVADTAHRHGVNLVALGDSYSSGIGIPGQVDANCFRSDHNYPSLVAGAIKADLTDVSCADATTAEMTHPQGTAPAQFKALDRDTDLVTLTIGGNDIGWSDVIGTCAQLTAQDPAGSPCTDALTEGGVDQVKRSIDKTGPKVAAVLAGIRLRAPHAKVLLVGYPDLFPDDGVACTSASVPFAAGDFAYLRDSEYRLNAMLAREARLMGARYVDTYKSSVGHDMCKAAGTRWIEPVVPGNGAAPAHPNALGQQAMAAVVEKHIDDLRPRVPHLPHFPHAPHHA